MTGGEQAYLALVLIVFGAFAAALATAQIREGRARRAALAATPDPAAGTGATMPAGLTHAA